MPHSCFTNYLLTLSTFINHSFLPPPLLCNGFIIYVSLLPKIERCSDIHFRLEKSSDMAQNMCSVFTFSEVVPRYNCIHQHDQAKRIVILPSTASWEVGVCPLWLIQNSSRSSAISSSTPYTLALLQKYVNQAYNSYKLQFISTRIPT